MRSSVMSSIGWLVMLLAAHGVSAGENPFLPNGQADVGWPSIRGPQHDAHSVEVGLAEHWPPEGPPVLWVKEIGQGYSAFVAQGRRVFTQAQSLAGQFVLCLDADTGETIWEHRYGLPYEAVGVYPGPRATPTLADDKVVFAAPAGVADPDGVRVFHQFIERARDGHARGCRRHRGARGR